MRVWHAVTFTRPTRWAGPCRLFRLARHLSAPDGRGAHGVLRSQPDGLNHFLGHATCVGAMPIRERALLAVPEGVTPPFGRRNGPRRRAARSRDRAGARCRPFGSFRFPGPALRTGRARSHASGSPRDHALFSCDDGFVGSGPRRRDARSPVAVSGGPEGFRFEQDHAAVRGAAPQGVAGSELLPVGPGVFAAEPSDHTPPTEVGEVTEGRRRRSRSEVVGPAPQDRVEPVLRALRPVPVPSADDVHSRRRPGWPTGRRHGDGSHVHHRPVDGIGAQLFPCRPVHGYPAALHRGPRRDARRSRLPRLQGDPSHCHPGHPPGSSRS